MEKDIFDYFEMMAEPQVAQPDVVVEKKEAVFCDKIKPTNNTLSFEDGNDFANAIGDDYYDADGDYSEARGKKRGFSKGKKRGFTRGKKRGFAKSPVIKKKKPIRPVSVKNTRIVELGTKSNIKKQVLNALDGDEFFNARGGRGGGARRGGGGGFRGGYRGGFRHRRPIIRGGGGLWWNGAYWVDGAGLCYTKDWQGNFVLANCNVVPSVALGL